MTLPYAEDVNYFKTSQSPADSWVDKTVALIRGMGGEVLAEAFGNSNGRAAYMIDFRIGQDRYRIVWPVLPVRAKGNERAARVQAATMMYHDVKAKCLTASVMGTRAAFFNYVLLPDGRNVTQLSTPELLKASPDFLQLPAGNDGDVVDGDYEE
jgi:hypothetical protein